MLCRRCNTTVSSGARYGDGVRCTVAVCLPGLWFRERFCGRDYALAGLDEALMLIPILQAAAEPPDIELEQAHRPYGLANLLPACSPRPAEVARNRGLWSTTVCSRCKTTQRAPINAPHSRRARRSAGISLVGHRELNILREGAFQPKQSGDPQ
jgi:hypothetical protein